jgi:hypothetical protein
MSNPPLSWGYHFRFDHHGVPVDHFDVPLVVQFQLVDRLVIGFQYLEME